MILQFRPNSRPFGLTRRELEVLDLAAEGLGNKQIAAALVVQEQTVKNHLSSAMRKLGAQSRVGAVLCAHAARVIDLDECWRRAAERGAA